MGPKHHGHENRPGGKAGSGSSGTPAAFVLSGLGSDVPELRQARALWQRNRFEESLEHFEAAVRKYPQNRVALIDASRALGARFEIERAEALLDRLIKLAGTEPDILHLAGQSYRMIFRPERAMECFQQVLALTQEIPDAYLELAILHERRHRVEAAYTLIEDCLRAAPDYLEAELFKARLLRRMQGEAESEALLRKLTADPAAHTLVRAQAWAEIAQAHDRRGEYAEAMSTMIRCKELLLPHAAAARQESNVVLRQLCHLTESLTAADFERWKQAAETFPPQRNAVLTGFPRSGTTLLEQILDAHSGLVSSDEREAFARDIFPALWMTSATPVPTSQALDATPVERLRLLRERYRAYMTSALNVPIGGRLHLDKNPTLTLVLPGFLRLFPEARVLVALRDPRDIVLSCFMQYLPLNPNSVCFLTLEDTARRYAADLAVWRRLRELIASPWLEVRYEETVANVPGAARRALDFLGLPWEPQVLNYRERLGQKAVSSPTYEAVRQPVHSRAIGRWKNYQKYLDPYLSILHPSIEAFGY